MTPKLTLVHLFIWPCNFWRREPQDYLMDEGRATEHVAHFEFTIAVRQPKHPVRPSDSSHVGSNEPEVGPNCQSQLDL